MELLLNVSYKILNSQNVDPISTATTDILVGGQQSTDILSAINGKIYNDSQYDVYSLFDNFTIAKLGGNQTYYQQNNRPYESRLIFGYLQLSIVVCGLIGNSLAIAVLTRPKYRNSSTATYLTALAFSDIIILLSSPLVDFFFKVYDFDLRSHGTFWCKIEWWIIYGSVTTSSWLLVAVTIERTISVTFPYAVKRLCTPNISKIVVIAIWCAMYVLHSHFLYGMKKCYPQLNGYSVFLHKILPWIDITMVFGIPCFCIILGNIIIIVLVRRNFNNRQNMTRSKKKYSETSLIVTLVVVNIAFILTMSPLTIFNIIKWYFNTTSYTNDFVHSLLNFVSNVNASLNFFLYFLSGTKFRTDVKTLLKSVTRKLLKRRSEQLETQI